MRHALTVLLVLAVFACTPPANEPPPPVQPPTPPTTAPASPSEEPVPPLSAELSDVDLAAFQERVEAPRGNFATLSVEDAGSEAPLAIESVDVQVELVGRFARTEVKQVFRNHLPRETEGTYTFTLPEGAAISRLAMDVEGQMMEGELVERERARQIYEQIVRGQKDPALLEWQGGNRFKTQIFPIPASGTKTVILAYEQVLPDNRHGASYTYDLPRLEGDTQGSSLGSFTFALTAHHTRPLTARGYPLEIQTTEGVQKATLGREDFRPRGPLELHMAPAAERGPTTLYSSEGGETFFLLDHVPPIPAYSGARAHHLVVVLDTSAGLGHPVVEQSSDVARALIEALPESARVHGISGDHKVRRCATVPLSHSERSQALDCLGALDAGGATDLEALLLEATRAAAEMKGPTTVVFFSDGVTSLGELDGDLVRNRVLEALPDRAQLHTVVVGHHPDEAWMAGLASGGRGHSVRMRPIDDADAIAREVIELQSEPLLVDYKVRVESGAVSGLTPAQPIHVARGESVAVLGKIEQGPVTLVLEGTFAGQPVTQRVELAAPATPVARPLVRNFWARAFVEALQQGNAPRERIVQLSQHYGVMSRYTSFLVLENEEAYKRFNVERRKEAERVAKAGNLKKSGDDLSGLLNNPAAEDKEETVEEEEKEAAAPTESPAPAPAREKADFKAIESMDAMALGGEGATLAPGLGARGMGGESGKKLKKRGRIAPQVDIDVLRSAFLEDPSDAHTTRQYIRRRDQAGELDALFTDLESIPVTAERIGTLLEELRHTSAGPQHLDPLLDTWMHTTLTLHQANELLAEADLAQRAPAATFYVTQRLLRQRSRREAGLYDRYFRSADALHRYLDVEEHLRSICFTERVTTQQCLDWMALFRDDIDLTVLEDNYIDRRIAQASELRADDMGNPELILDFAELYRRQGDTEAAERLLSELVEFAPHDFRSRTRYATELVNLGQIEAACRQYASAVQLNPSERDTFRAMMALRRSHPQYARALRSCIVDGVSKLPVTRDVSLVLTWEDDSADVDLHIHEVGGEEVSFSNRESSNGGLLYYDITNGFGPEIYVLGQGPAGEYRLTVVYYSGSARQVKGTLTLLRNAGAPNEARRDIPFTLIGSDSNKQLPLGTFTLAADPPANPDGMQ